MGGVWGGADPEVVEAPFVPSHHAGLTPPVFPLGCVLHAAPQGQAKQPCMHVRTASVRAACVRPINQACPTARAPCLGQLAGCQAAHSCPHTRRHAQSSEVQQQQQQQVSGRGRGLSTHTRGPGTPSSYLLPRAARPPVGLGLGVMLGLCGAPQAVLRGVPSACKRVWLQLPAAQLTQVALVLVLARLGCLCVVQAGRSELTLSTFCFERHRWLGAHAASDRRRTRLPPPTVGRQQLQPLPAP